MAVQMATDDLVRMRRRADITQVEIAAELGISPRSVTAFENGAGLPKARTLADYIEAIHAIKARREAEKQAS